jgi:multiple sugar transport system permease protein
MALSLAIAMLVNRQKRAKVVIMLLFLIPLVIPSGSMVFFWKSFFAYDGYINGLLHAVGFPAVNWLETEMVRFVIVLIFLWKSLGYSVVLFVAGLNNIPEEYYQAAAVDGANAFQALRHITLANLAPTFILVMIMSVINSFKVFKEIYVITGSYPHDSIYMLQHFMNNMFTSLNYQRLTSATCLLVVAITLVTQFLLRAEGKAAS